MRQPAAEPYWNTNVARHPGILRSVPEGRGDALDVGCGDGLLARKLAGRAKHVTGIDKSPEMIACARELAAGHPQLTFVEGDFLTADSRCGVRLRLLGDHDPSHGLRGSPRSHA